MRNILIVSTLLLAAPVLAEGEVKLNVLEQGSVTLEDGLEAWSRIYEVASHPRCANCHVGETDQPMWSGPSYGKTRVHGMNIRAGESRIGSENLACSTCHAQSVNGIDAPHMAPQVDMNWQLAPVEADWFDKSSEDICAQLRDPERNGERTLLEVAEHLDHDLILHWAWNPGGGREPAPYSLQAHIDDIMQWGAAGAPCPQDDKNAEAIASVKAFLATKGDE